MSLITSFGVSLVLLGVMSFWVFHKSMGFLLYYSGGLSLCCSVSRPLGGMMGVVQCAKVPFLEPDCGLILMHLRVISKPY